MRHEQGFTIVEVIVAIMVLTVGLLALVTSAALVTRMIGRGQRSAVAAQYAQRRLEMLRTSGCKSQAGGSEVLMRGSAPLDSLKWRVPATAPRPLPMLGGSKGLKVLVEGGDRKPGKANIY